jgi:hypothetical protein
VLALCFAHEAHPHQRALHKPNPRCLMAPPQRCLAHLNTFSTCLPNSALSLWFSGERILKSLPLGIESRSVSAS